MVGEAWLSCWLRRGHVVGCGVAKLLGEGRLICCRVRRIAKFFCEEVLSCLVRRG